MLAMIALAAAAYAHPEQLVDTAWLAAHYADANVRVVDMRQSATAFPAGHAPGAVYLSPVAIREATRPPTWLATASDVVGSIDKAGVKIVDARTQAEIEGKDLRNIKRGGFVPSSIPVYWEDLLDAQRRTFKSADELKAIYEARGITPSNEVIVYCQVGMRASVDLFALHLIGYHQVRHY